MKLKIILTLIFVYLILTGQKIQAQEFPSNLLRKIPQVAEKLYSDNLDDQISILDNFIIIKDEDCYADISLSKDFEADEIAFVIRSIFERDLSQINIRKAAEALWKIEFLMKKLDLKIFSKDLAAYLSKFPVNNEQDISQIGIIIGILDTLKTLKAKETAPEMAALLQSPFFNVHREALFTLVEIEAREAIPSLIVLLSDPDHLQRFFALQSLVKVNGKEAGPQIAKLLYDENNDNRYWALDTLVKVDAREQSKDIWKFIEKNTDQKLEGFAVAVLLAFEQKEAIPFAVNRLKANAQGNENYYVWEFITELKPKFVIQPLISLYSSKEKYFAAEEPEKKFREIIFRILFDYKTPLAIPIYRQNLVEKSYYGSSWKPRNDVAGLLQELNAVEALDDLISLFNDALKPEAGSETNYAAGDLGVTLAKFGDKKVWKMLIDYVGKTDFYQRDLIIAELNKQLDPKLWNLIQSKKVSQITYNSVKLIAETGSRETGVPISFEYTPKKDTIRCQPLDSGDTEGMPCGNIDGGTSLANLVITVANQLNYDQRGKYTFLFENGTIRILTVEKAVEWWRKNIFKE